MSALRVVAHGGGVQSTALLVLSAQHKIDFPVHLFCNVGDDSEHPKTLEYVRNVSIPYAEEHGIKLHELHRFRKDLTAETLFGRLTKPGGQSLPIPVRYSATGPPVSRAERAGRGRNGKLERRIYPLLELGLRRSDCLKLIRDAGLPEPRPSSCFFCPFHRPQAWAEQARDEPRLFEAACQLEEYLGDRQEKAGKDRVYLTRYGRPLREAIGPAQDMLPGFGSDIGEDGCDSGYCFV